MSRRALLVALTVLALPLAGCGDDDDAAEPGSPLATDTADARADVDVAGLPLEPRGGEDLSGTVRVSSAGKAGTLIVITLDNPSDPPLTAHVHRDRCAELGEDAAVAHKLEPAGGEPVETALDVPLRSLLEPAHAVALHAPGGEHVACADIAPPGGQ